MSTSQLTFDDLQWSPPRRSRRWLLAGVALVLGVALAFVVVGALPGDRSTPTLPISGAVPAGSTTGSGIGVGSEIPESEAAPFWAHPMPTVAPAVTPAAASATRSQPSGRGAGVAPASRAASSSQAPSASSAPAASAEAAPAPQGAGIGAPGSGASGSPGSPGGQGQSTQGGSPSYSYGYSESYGYGEPGRPGQP